jgi:hypothetical protein
MLDTQKQRRITRLVDKLERIATKALGLSELLGQPMNSSEFRNHHEREAARLRTLIAIVSTPALKERLLEQAEEQERLAEDVEDLIKVIMRASFP